MIEIHEDRFRDITEEQALATTISVVSELENRFTKEQFDTVKKLAIQATKFGFLSGQNAELQLQLARKDI